MRWILKATIILSLIGALAGAEVGTALAKPIPRCPQYEPLLKRYGLPVLEFSYVMWHESRCQPTTIGDNGAGVKPDYGLVQIQGSWVTVTSTVCKSKWGDMKVLLKPDCNLAVARYLYKHGGLAHWVGAEKSLRKWGVASTSADKKKHSK